MEEMNIEEEKIIGKKRIFYHLLERSKNEWNQRKGIFSFVWYTKAKENIICVAIIIMPFEFNTTINFSDE